MNTIKRNSKGQFTKYNNNMLGVKRSEKTKIKLSESHKGITPVGSWKKGHIPWNKDKECLSSQGSNNGNWKGGTTSLLLTIRHGFKYRQWRDDVFTRDEFTCQECGQIGGKLNAHHIKSFSFVLQKYEITTLEEALECEELWNINNGIILCKECHKKTGNYLTNQGRRDLRISSSF